MSDVNETLRMLQQHLEDALGREKVLGERLDTQAAKLVRCAEVLEWLSGGEVKGTERVCPICKLELDLSAPKGQEGHATDCHLIVLLEELK